MAETVYLFEAQPYNPATSSVVNAFFSSGLRTEGDLETQPDPYPVRLTQAFRHETSVFEDNVPGQTSISVGNCTILNTDGRFDYLLDYEWDSRTVVIKKGVLGQAYSQYTTVFIGSTLEITADQQNLVIQLRDNSYKLLVPIQKNKYDGSGGLGGTPDMKEKVKPLLFGKARNLSPIWLDPVLLTMQVHDGSITSVDAVYDKANLLTFHQDFASYSALISADIPPGKYATCLTLGVIRLGAPPAGSLTVDAVGQFGTVTNLPELIKQILLNRLLLTSGEIDTAGFTQASLDMPQNFEGLYFPEPDFQYDALLETIATSLNAYWYVTRTGLITFRKFQFHTPSYTVRQEDLVSLGKTSSPYPIYKATANYAKNMTPQSPSDFSIPRQTFNGYLTKRYHYVDTSVVTPDFSGAGQFKVFLNDQQVNDLTEVQFSIPNGESWITIDSQGNITVTDSGAPSASAVVRANLGEYLMEEIFTLVQDSTSPLQDMELSLSADRFYFDDDGQPSPTSQIIDITATGTNTTDPITITAVDNLGNPVAISPDGSTVDSISKSPLVFWVEVTAKSADNVYQKRRIMVQHGNDALGQAVLGALAATTGVVTFYFQTAAPTSGLQINDVWVDLDDGNKMYRWDGTEWATVSDTRIIDALTQAAGAQATADGKIKTYLSSTEPTGTFSLGDLWYDPDDQTLYRWDGTDWSSAVATYGADLDINVIGYSYSSVVTESFQFSNDKRFTRRWNVLQGSAVERTLNLHDPAAPGGSYVRFGNNAGNDFVVLDLNSRLDIPYDPSQLYEITFWVRQVSGTGIAYLGFEGIDANGNPVNSTGAASTSAQFFVALNGAVVPSSWTQYTGYVKGSSASPVVAQAADPALPAQVHSNVAKLRPLIYMNSPGNAGQFDVAMVRVRKVNVTRTGSSLADSSGTILTDPSIKNTAISIGADGTLNGAGGGQVTVRGLGYLGDLSATKNLSLYSIGTGTMAFTGNTVTKATGSGWDTNFISKQFYSRSCVASALLPDSNTLFGLVDTTTISAGNVGNSWRELDYSVNNSGSSWTLYESGSGTALGTSFNGVTFSATTVWQIVYDGTQVVYLADGVVMKTSPTTAGRTFYVSGTISAVGNKVSEIQFYSAHIRPRAGATLEDNSGAILADSAIKNTGISISSSGVLSGAGGGTVTLQGIGHRGYTSSGSILADDTFNSNSWSIWSAGGSRQPRGATNGFAIGAAEYNLELVPQAASAGADHIYVPLNPNTDYTASVKIQRNSSATGTVNASVFAYDASGTYLGSFSLGSKSTTDVTAGAAPLEFNWKFTSPATARQCYVRLNTEANGAPAGAWRFESPKVQPFEAGATKGARSGTNLLDNAGVLLNDSLIKNSGITISAGGVLSGAGGGSVTYAGLGGGPVGLQTDLRLGGAYLKDSVGSTLNDADIKNTGITISAGGVLSGAGGGSVTYAGLGGGPVGLQTDLRLGGAYLKDSVGSTLNDADIKNSGITLSADGVLSGAGGGSIAYDSIPQGTTYGKILLSDLTSGFRHKLTDGSSGQQLGDARNLPPVSGVGGRYKFTGSLSWSSNSTTSITIQAGSGTLYAGSATTSYSLMTDNVTGTSGTTRTYFLYVSSNPFVDGSHVLRTTTNGNTVYQNDNNVYIGSVTVTFPISGTTSGTGTSGGGFGGSGGSAGPSGGEIP